MPSRFLYEGFRAQWLELTRHVSPWFPRVFACLDHPSLGYMAAFLQERLSESSGDPLSLSEGLRKKDAPQSLAGQALWEPFRWRLGALMVRDGLVLEPLGRRWRRCTPRSGNTGPRGPREASGTAFELAKWLAESGFMSHGGRWLASQAVFGPFSRRRS